MVRRAFRVVGLVGTLGLVPGMATAQTSPTDEQRALAAAVAERFEVGFLTDGLALVPRDRGTDVSLVELRNGTIGIDGVIVTGQELYERLDDDAALVLRVSYLAPSVRASVFDRPADTPAPAAAGSSERSSPAPRERRSSRSRESRTTRGDVVRVGGPVSVEVDERVRGDVVVIGGPLRVDGEVTGDVVVIGGRARFGPEAEVDGDVTVLGGPIDRASTARLRRGLNQVWLGDLDFNGLNLSEWFGRGGRALPRPPPVSPGWDLGGTVLRLLFLALLASLVVLVARGPVERAADRSVREPVKAGVVGLLTQLLLGPLLVLAVLLLVVSIIGIPLLVLVPFGLLALLLVMLVGFAGAAYALGRWIRARFGLQTHPIYLSIWVGTAALLIPTMAGEAFEIAGGPLGFLAVLFVLTGVVVEYAAWTTGFGALVLNRLDPLLSPPPASGGPETPVVTATAGE